MPACATRISHVWSRHIDAGYQPWEPTAADSQFVRILGDAYYDIVAIPSSARILRAEWRHPRYSELRYAEKSSEATSVLFGDCVCVEEAIIVDKLGFGSDARAAGKVVHNIFGAAGVLAGVGGNLATHDYVQEGQLSADLALIYTTSSLRYVHHSISQDVAEAVAPYWPEAVDGMQYLELLKRHNTTIRTSHTVTADGVDAFDVTQLVQSAVDDGRQEILFFCASVTPEQPVAWVETGSLVTDAEKPHLLIEFRVE